MESSCVKESDCFFSSLDQVDGQPTDWVLRVRHPSLIQSIMTRAGKIHMEEKNGFRNGYN